MAGCVAQAEGGEILRRQKAVDLVVGPQSYHHLPELLRQATGRGGIVDTEFPIVDKFALLPAPLREKTMARGVSAFVTVQEGCDKFCSFCVVPYTRGAKMSRPVAALIAEVEALAADGVREVTLLGQNVMPITDWTAMAESSRSAAFARVLPRCRASPVSAIRRAIQTTWTPI